DTPLPEPMDDLAVRDPDKEVLAAFLELMEFRSLARRVGDGSAAAAPRSLDTPSGARPAATPGAPVLSVSYGRPSDRPAAEPVAIDHGAYVCVRDLPTLEAWIARARAVGVVAFDTETDALSSATAGLVGVSLAVAPGEACYIPLAHEEKAEGLAFETLASLEQIPLVEAIAALKPLLEDPAVLKVAQNAKYDMAVLARYGVAVGPIDDTMLISYVLEAGLHGHGMDELSELWLGHKPIPFKQVAGSGKAQISFKHVGLTEATAYAAEDADVTLRLYHVLRPRLAQEGLLTVYETLERPLPAVLAAMENTGIRVDPDTLRRLSNEFSMRMVDFEARAQEIVGRPFNLGSPKQIGDVLFGELQLKGGKKTATGQWSTDSDVLESLAAEHELPRVLLDWRQLSKLKGTYTENLIAAIAPGGENRVHTSYALASTTTGRLSSSDPNLQNIPVRTEEGRKIRKAFVAKPGHLLISADYSQIELRLLAHIGDIPQLKSAFREGLDIHAMTASEMFGVPIKGMPSDVRRRAKAINFGIVYGISAFGLANQLGIGQGEAGAYIKTYFERFPGIQAYMDATKAFVREHGFVTTIFGRKINIPDIHAKSAAQRQFSERAAINAPIQGAAADVMRRAMIRMPGALVEAGLSARVLLQVHDELVFEAPESEAEATCAVARKVMQGAAAPAVDISVPLTVEARAAHNWDEAH
ncbi:DNA polymerase I, partial [Caulobacter sp. B11]|uniref:DNA polymerase I n=1 Tax=Caulobacter sp. B11 TaxID=2048899 RepID=UPI000C12A00C